MTDSRRVFVISEVDEDGHGWLADRRLRHGGLFVRLADATQFASEDEVEREMDRITGLSWSPAVVVRRRTFDVTESGRCEVHTLAPFVASTCVGVASPVDIDAVLASTDIADTVVHALARELHAHRNVTRLAGALLAQTALFGRQGVDETTYTALNDAIRAVPR